MFKCWCKLLVIFLCSLCPLSLLSQFDHDYHRLKPNGKTPAYLSIPFLEEHNPFDNDSVSSFPKTEEDFWQESNYYLNQLLLSGKVLYNDTVSNYVNRVADQLLRYHPQLRRKFRFFAVKSPSLNAFSSNQGVVLINVGLIARLENEAQLAYIMSHEISHIVNKHQMDFYLTAHKLNQQMVKASDLNMLEQIMMEKRLYSQEKELEADIDGLKFFLSSKYDIREILPCFDIIQYKHLAFKDTFFHPSFFDIPHLQYPGDYLLSLDDSIPEEFKIYHHLSTTHPTTEKRKRELFKNLFFHQWTHYKRKKFIVGQDQFAYIREVCRFETCFSYLINREYERALYWAFLLSERYPDNFFLKKCIGQSLYCLAKYKQYGKFWEIHTNYEEVSGKARSLFYLFEQLPPEALLTLALGYNWRLHQVRPHEEALYIMIEDLMAELGYHYVDHLSYYHDRPPIQTAEDFHRYAFVEALQEEQFVHQFNRKLKIEKNTEREDSLQMEIVPPEDITTRLEKGINLGLDKVVMIDPKYYVVDDRLTRKDQLESGSRKQTRLIDLLESHAESVELNYQILSGKYLSPFDDSSHNDLYLLNEWFEEKSHHEDIPIVSMYHDEIQRLKQKYGTTHFAWIEAGNIANSRSNRGLVLSAGILLPVLLPYSIFYTQTPRHLTFLYGIIYDVETGREMAKYPKKVMMKDRMDVLHSIVYDFVFQLKHSSN